MDCKSLTAHLSIASVVLIGLLVGCSKDEGGTPSGPAITVQHPASGEKWLKEIPYEIVWSAEDMQGQVQIELSQNGGTSYTLQIAANADNDGSFFWTIAYDASPSCKLRIRSSTDTSVAGESEVFTIQALIWDTVASGATDVIYDVEVVGNEAWAVGLNGTVLHKAEGINIWVRQSAATSSFLYSVSFASQLEGWFVGTNRSIFKTVSGGASWVPQGTFSTDAILSVFAIDGQNAWAVSQRTRYHTSNGGQVWAEAPLGAGITMEEIFFVNESDGWAVGLSSPLPFVEHTTDGGVTWTPQTVGGTGALIAIHALNDSVAAVAGTLGKIFYTVDGGATWQDRSVATTFTLTAVRLLDRDRLWVSGNNGVVMHSPDAGLHWGTIPSGYPAAQLRGLEFGTDNKIYFATTLPFALTATLASIE